MKPLTFEIYKGKDGFRWRLKASNGQIMADSGEAYSRKSRALDAIKTICRSIASGVMIEDKAKR